MAEEVKAGIAPDRIAIGGFSQGGHVSLKTLHHTARPPAGCIALSTWLEPSPSLQVTLFSPPVQTSLCSMHMWQPLRFLMQQDCRYSAPVYLKDRVLCLPGSRSEQGREDLPGAWDSRSPAPHAHGHQHSCAAEAER